MSHMACKSSDAGVETRSVLMSVAHILNKRRGNVSLKSIFKDILRIAEPPRRCFIDPGSAEKICITVTEGLSLK